VVKRSRTTPAATRPFITAAAVLTACVLASAPAHAQVDCWAPREHQDSVNTPRFAPMKQTLLAVEDVIRRARDTFDFEALAALLR
jgi:hypothetical protein